MKKILPIFIILILYILLFHSTGIAQQVPGPSILIDNPVFDAKEIREGSQIEHTFIVKNPGNQPLLINNIKPG